MSMQPQTIPNLAANEHGFLLDTGESVAVAILPQPYGPTDSTVNVMLRARMVDPATGQTVMVGRHSVQAPGCGYGVLASALADGMDLTLIVADGMGVQAQRVRALKAALTSLDSLGG